MLQVKCMLAAASVLVSFCTAPQVCAQDAVSRHEAAVAAYRQAQLKEHYGLTPAMRLPELRNLTVSQPVTVQGKYQSVVVNSTSINTGIAYGSGLDVKCPTWPTGRVIVSGNRAINTGRIVAAPGASGVIAINCLGSYSRGNISVSRNVVINTGQIR
jgi:hypothetical protein